MLMTCCNFIFDATTALTLPLDQKLSFGLNTEGIMMAHQSAKPKYKSIVYTL